MMGERITVLTWSDCIGWKLAIIAFQVLIIIRGQICMWSIKYHVYSSTMHQENGRPAEEGQTHSESDRRVSVYKE